MEKLIKKINKIPKSYFSLADIRKISGLNDASLKVALSRLVKSEALIKASHRLYALPDAIINWEEVAIASYRPSYLSFEWILAKYNILSQQPAGLTLATLKRSKNLATCRNPIIYHHLQESLFWGYEKKDKILAAHPEKSLIDLAYLSLNGYAKFDPEEMNLKPLNKNKIKQYLRKINNKKLTNLVNSIYDKP
ncbi:MAG: hypothetical protein WCV70_01675 [Patescibacteria group bacterium]|jgi:predicted transcriptional regulator of viral defense system